VYEASAGSRANTLDGYPVVILTRVGARSGKVRKNPVMRLVDGDRYVVVASAAGRSVHPVWYRNIVAHPIVRVQDARPPAPTKPKKCVATRHRRTGSWPTTPSRSSRNTAKAPAGTSRSLSSVTGYGRLEYRRFPIDGRGFAYHVV
jgi:deazaflavin-dependent oxidoreductase (nitroreductase family)